MPTHYTTGGVGQKKEVTELLITPHWEPKYKPKITKHSLDRFFSKPQIETEIEECDE